MRKHFSFVGLVLIMSAMVVASPKMERKEVKSHPVVCEYPGHCDLFLTTVAGSFDHFVPMVQGGKLMHAEKVVFIKEGYSPVVTAMARGPTTSKFKLLPFIRDKNGK